MAIFEINLKNDEDYAVLCNSLLLTITLFVILHVLLSYAYNGVNSSLFSIFSGSLFNNDFINVFVFFVLGILAYYLVVRKIILFN